MIRILVSIVFAFGILAASSAHASMLPVSFEHVQSTGMADRYVQCQIEFKTLIANAGSFCPVTAHKTNGSQRCQVDIAPIADRVTQFGKRGLLVVSSICDSTPKDWLNEPALGPPRLI